MDKLVGIAEARLGFKDLIENLHQEPVWVLRYNKPVAVMLHPDQLEALQTRIEDLEDQLALTQAGDTEAYEIARKDLGLADD